MMKQILLFFTLFCATTLSAQVNFTANNQVVPYTGRFRPGINMGYNPGWDNKQLANIAAGNSSLNIKGIGAKANRQGLYEEVLGIYGYNAASTDFQHYGSVGMSENVAILGGPLAWHKDFSVTSYCNNPSSPYNGTPSNMFGNMYLPIWDGGANGTPYNDDNLFAAYVYKTVSQYKDEVRFWEIWNEPGLDLRSDIGGIGWRDQNYPGNWWLEGPSPCDYILHAPIYNYIRALRISWEIIKTVDPDSYVCLGSVGYQSMLNAILRNTDNPNNGDVSAEYPLTAGAYFDCISFHSYPHFDGSTTNYDQNFFERHSDQAADGLTSYRNYYQQILNQYGYDGNTYPKKEWIVTEINSPRKAFSGTYFAGYDAQINHMMKAFMVAKLEKIHQLHTYQLFDQTTEAGASYEFHQMGLYKTISNGTTAYNQVVNDEGIAMKTMTDLIYNTDYDAARTAAMNLPAGARGYAWKRADGTYIYSVWAKTTEDLSEAAFATYSFPSSFNLTNVVKYNWDYGYTGTTQSISSNNIQLNARPVFFTATGPISTCTISASFSNTVCNNNGTDSNPADDTFTTTMTVNGSGGSGNWTATIGGQTVTGTIGTPKALGPFPISGGNVFFTVRDANTSTCATEAGAIAPAACSNSGGGGGTPGNYCASKSDFPWHDWIAKVQVGTINNTSSKSNYSDFTSQTTNLVAGSSNPISLTSGFSYFTYNEYWTIWIDANRNGTFETSEKVFEGVQTAPTAGTPTAVFNGNLVVPATATTGATRMRVSMKRDAYATPCETLPFGEVEDYTVNITGGGSGGNTCSINATVSAVTCNNNGTASNTGDDTYTYTLTVTGTNTSSGWSTVVNGTTISGTYGTPKTFGPYPIAGGSKTMSIKDNTTATCTTSATATAPAPCSNGGGGVVPYCASKSDFPWHDWIGGVRISNVNNASGKSAYSDFTNQSATLSPGTNNIALTAGFSYFTYNEYWKVWIDYNKNGTFEEPSELAYQGIQNRPSDGTPSATLNATFTIPTGTAPGATRMRVSMKRDAYSTPCETLPFGEVEDYTVVIPANQMLVAPVSQQINADDAVFFFEVAKLSEGIHINWADYNDAEVARFEVQKSSDGTNWKWHNTLVARSNKIGIQTYSDLDLYPIEGNNHYRLKITMVDGQVQYSQERQLLINIPNEFGLFPNPAKDMVTLDLSGFTSRQGVVRIFNAMGNLVQEFKLNENTGANLDISLDKYNSGQYIVQISVEGRRSVTKKLLVEKL